MKIRFAFLLMLAGALVAAGCGSDDGDKGDKGSGSKGDTKTSSKAETAAEKEVAKDRKIKTDQVDGAKEAFKDKPKDIGACRNLANAYVALASPASVTDPKATPPTLPKDRDENLGRAIDTLEECVSVSEGDRDVQQMLASTYMATNQFDKATPLLEKLATSAKGQERANAYYAWGLAASSAQEYTKAIGAWRQFIKLAPAKDPRRQQVASSIKALAQAAKAPKPTPAPAATPAANAEAEADDSASTDG